MKIQLLKVAKFKDICMLWSTNLLSTIKRFVNFCNFADQSYIFKALKRALSSGVDIFSLTCPYQKALKVLLLFGLSCDVSYFK